MRTRRSRLQDSRRLISGLLPIVARDDGHATLWWRTVRILISGRHARGSWGFPEWCEEVSRVSLCH